MQTNKPVISSNQSCFTANKRSRCSSLTGTCVYCARYECNCKIQWYTILMLSLSILGLELFIILKSGKLKLIRGHLFSNAVKIMLIISDTQYYVPIKLCRMAGSINLFKITGILTPENVKLKRNILWDIMELDWKEVNMTLNGNKINLATSVTVMFRGKFKIRSIVKREPLLFHIMLK